MNERPKMFGCPICGTGPTCANCNRAWRGKAYVIAHGPDAHSPRQHEHCVDCGRILKETYSSASVDIAPKERRSHAGR